LAGAVPTLRRSWLRRVGWYPGDWIWVSLLMLLVALAGAAVAIAFGRGSSTGGATTFVAPAPRPARAAAPLPGVPEPGGRRGARRAAAPSAPANVGTRWPTGRNGWTIVLSSYPLASGTTAPYSTAARAARGGLPEVGVIDSGRFSSLHPGYYVVVSGVYSTPAEAEAALRSVRA